MKTLKTLITGLILLLFYAPAIHAQWWEWSGVQPLIPQQDNSANVSVNFFAAVWEHQVDETTTAIYGRLTIPGSEPVVLVQIPGVLCTKPGIYFFNQPFVLFETNLNGNIDIYGIILDDQGNPLGDIQPVVISSANDQSINLIDFVTLNVAWLENDDLKAGTLSISASQIIVNEAVAMDTGGCSDPYYFLSYPPRLFWTKQEENDDAVMFSDYLFGGGWTTPAVFESAEQIQGFQVVNSFMMIKAMSFTFLEEGNWFIKDYFFDYSPSQPDTLIPEIQQDHPFDFDTYCWLPGVKSGSDDWWGFIYQAYAGNVGEHDEIFMNGEDWNPNTYSNFSQLGVNCRNPRFYEGEWLEWNGINLYLTWEAYVDGKWQVYYSTTPISVGGIEENEASLIKDISISPNPFSDKFQISFDMEKTMPVTVDLMDIHGRVLMNLLTENCAEGSFSRTFDMAGFAGQGSLYFIRFGVEGEYSFEKVVKGR